MKTILIVIIYTLIYLFCTNQTVSNDEEKYIKIEDAIKKNFIKTEVIGKGGHEEECVMLKIKNISEYDTTFYIEPGRRIASEDSSVQDILIVKEKMLLLASGEEATIDAYGFCCQVHNASPVKGEKFYIGNMADESLVKLAEFLNKNDFPAGAMQGAVWVVSDNNPLSCINSYDSTDVLKIRELQKFVAKLKKIPLDYTWYSIQYKSDTTMLFSGVADTLYGEIEYELWNNCKANLIMYDERGSVLFRFFVDKHHNPDKYTYPVKFSVDGWRKGNYYIRLIADGQMKIEKKFKI